MRDPLSCSAVAKNSYLMPICPYPLHNSRPPSSASPKLRRPRLPSSPGLLCMPLHAAQRFSPARFDRYGQDSF
jgi:hypothetical protein